MADAVSGPDASRRDWTNPPCIAGSETISVALAGLVVVVGYEATIAMVRRGFNLSGDLLGRAAVRVEPFGNTAFALGDYAVPLLVGAALLYRHRPRGSQTFHGMATLSLMAEPLAHLFGHFSSPLPLLWADPFILLFSVRFTIALRREGCIRSRSGAGRSFSAEPAVCRLSCAPARHGTNSSPGLPVERSRTGRYHL